MDQPIYFSFFGQRLPQGSFISQINFIVFDSNAGDRFDLIERLGRRVDIVVDGEDLKSFIDQIDDGVTSYISASARDKYLFFHKFSKLCYLLPCFSASLSASNG